MLPSVWISDVGRKKNLIHSQEFIHDVPAVGKAGYLVLASQLSMFCHPVMEQALPGFDKIYA